MTRIRIETIRKKRNAMQKYLRNDVTDLLKNGYDFNAYSRAEGLMLELNRSKCYEFVEQCCVHISPHLADMNKMKECPEECREAVASLMHAAARFADLPELRELRTIFSERYGSSLDCYVNKQFVENLKSGFPSKDMKLEMLQEIAAESGLEWDPKALEDKLCNGKNLAEGTNEIEGCMPDNVDSSGRKNDFRGTVNKFNDVIEHVDDTGSPLSRGSEEVPPVKDIQVDTIHRTGKKIEPESLGNVANEEHEDEPIKYKSIPPPYTKSEDYQKTSSLKGIQSDSSIEKIENPEHDACVDAENSHGKAKPVPKSVRRRNLKSPPGQEVASTSVGSERDGGNKEKAAEIRRILKFFDKGGRDGRDEEEKMDKLLLRFSMKKGPHERRKSDPVLKPLHDPTPAESTKRKHANRLSSLPGELTSPKETPRTHVRASSFQPELLNANAHVHPNLPDYDEFVARLASLRGN